jgi:hypothetical protein
MEPGLPAVRFGSAPRMLARSAGVFFKNLRFLATLTLIVYLPGKLLVQLACFTLDIPTSGILSYFLLALSDLVLAALAVPAAIYGLTRSSGIAESLRLARERWGRMLWNEFKVEITVTLWGALLIVPGLIAMVRLILVEPVVALEDVLDPLARSRELTRGHRWRIFGVVAPLESLPKRL